MSEKILEELQKLNFKIGSVEITTFYNDKGELKKNLFYGRDWHKPKIVKEIKFKKIIKDDNDEPIIKDETHIMNGYYVITGKESNIIVLDLDDMNNEHCKELHKLCGLYGAFTVNTRKGHHFYFQYDDDFKTKLQGRDDNDNVIFDLQTNGQQIICPPSTYSTPDGNINFEYKILSQTPYEIKPMHQKIKEYLLNFKNNNTKTIKSNKSCAEKKVIQPTNTIIDSTIIQDELIIRLINGLNEKRSTQTDNWLTASYCFHNSKYDLKYFDYFSKLHYKKYNSLEVSIHYDKLKIKTDIDKQLTMATLWAWLKEDNEGLFAELKKETTPEHYKITIDKYECLSYERLYKLVEDDQQELGEDYYYTFKNSRSFQYFNHFFIWLCPQSTMYKIDDKGPLPYDTKCFPDLKVIQFVKKEDKHGNINIEKKGHCFVNMWIKSKEMRKIAKFVFNPNPEYINNKEEVNLFNGFPLDKNNDGTYDESLIKVYLDHIKRICNNEKDVYDYVLNWFAHIIQKPHVRTTVALVFYSDTEGVGKNLIFDVLNKILGKYYLKLKSTEEFTINFNSHHQNKLLGVCDEINARARSISDELKDAISRNTMVITYKGKESYVIDDYINLVLTTNNEGVLKVPRAGRRFEIIGCPEQKIDREVTKKILNIMNDDKLLMNVYNYFKNRDITEFDPRLTVMTDYKKTLIINDLPAYIKMLKFNAELYNDSSVNAKELYINSLEYARLNKMQSTYTDQKCSKDLQEFFGKYYVRVNNKRLYKFPKDFSDIVDDLVEKACNQQNK